MTSTRNKTINLNQKELELYKKRLLTFDRSVSLGEFINKTIQQDMKSVLSHLPDGFVDLLILDPPYNLDKKFNSSTFKRKSDSDYQAYLESWFSLIPRLLKATASVYFCCDWRCSNQVYEVLKKHLNIRNRITWEREKGRGARKNWKNCSEDIWFATVSEDYTFNVDSVKTRRPVIAPYRDKEGKPKDWQDSDSGKFRDTFPSNMWTDLTVPFWSMAENTPHSTQKPEKLLAKLILASSNEGDVVLDPFLGSGTTSVVAKKLSRNYVGIERDLEYACLAEKRLTLANDCTDIQGYCQEKSVFYPRNFRSV